MTWIVIAFLLYGLLRVPAPQTCPDGYIRAPYSDMNVVKCVPVEHVSPQGGQLMPWALDVARSDAKWCRNCGQEGLRVKNKTCQHCGSSRLVGYREEDALEEGVAA